jgi:dienelactone hydrolase
VILPEDYYLKLYHASPRRLAFRPEYLHDFDTWSGQVRGKLRELLRLEAPMGVPQVQVLERIEVDGLQREYVLIHDELFGPLPAFVLRPVELDAPAPGVICLHGHGGYFAGKDMVAGNTETHAIALECGEALNYAYGVQVARAGFVAICPDAYNFGERVLGEDRWAQGHICDKYLSYIINTGYSSSGVTTRGNVLVLEYLLSRADVSGASAGCVGLSFGGFQALLLAAVEERIAATVISGAMSSYESTMAPPHGSCGAQTIPGVLEWFDMPDIAASLAPRPVLCEMMKQDCCFDFELSMRLYRQLAEVYSGIGAGDHLGCDVADTDHRYIGNKVPEFLRRNLA